LVNFLHNHSGFLKDLDFLLLFGIGFGCVGGVHVGSLFRNFFLLWGNFSNFGRLSTKSSNEVSVDELVGEFVDLQAVLVKHPPFKGFSLGFRYAEDSSEVSSNEHQFLLPGLLLLLLGELLGFLVFLLEFLLLLLHGLFQGLLLLFELLLEGLLLLFVLLLFQGLLHHLLLLLELLLESLFLLLHLLFKGLLLQFLLLILAVLEKLVQDLLGLAFEILMVIFARNEWSLAFFIDNSEESVWSLRWVLELEEWVWMRLGGFTLGTEVKVFQHRRLVAHSYNRSHATAITGVAMVHNLTLGHH